METEIMDNTLEKNTLIDIFMGAEYSLNKEYLIRNINHPFGAGKIDFNELEYHKSWNWLMPVVEKIEDLKAYGKYEVDCAGNSCYITYEDVFYSKQQVVSIPESCGYTKFNSIFLAVVEFIKYYNKENKTNE